MVMKDSETEQTLIVTFKRASIKDAAIHFQHRLCIAVKPAFTRRKDEVRSAAASEQH